jgi:Outer membrane protein beta-barrel domain
MAWDELKAGQGEIMIKQRLGIIAGIAGLVFSAHAQDYTAPQQAQTSPSNYYDDREYHACEVSVDGFGVGVLHEYDFNGNGLHRKNYRFGGGAGINLFFTKYLGIGADAYAISPAHRTFVDTTTGNLILRMPIGDTGLAPYIFGGAGYEFKGIDQIVGGGGVGLEMRIVKHFSFFVDARYLAAVKTPDYGLGRAGVRLSF